MDELLPELGIVVEVIGCITNQALAVGADVLVARCRQDAVAVADHVADRLEQVAEPFGLHPVVAGHRRQRYRSPPSRRDDRDDSAGARGRHLADEPWSAGTSPPSRPGRGAT